MSNKAPWISIEGVDGAGKSSHIADIVRCVTEAGFEVVSTREPGGTEVCERLRQEILFTPMALQTAVLLAFASRAEHLAEVIRPALSNNQAVVCDRFTDSTYAYQGAGDGYPMEQIEQLEQMVHGDIKPDLTLVFDLSVEEAQRRLGGTGKNPDKFEKQSPEYFNRVRDAYLERARNEPQRFRVIDSSLPFDQVNKNAQSVVKDFLLHWEHQQAARAKSKSSLG